MTKKSDFTPEEWQQLMQAPMTVSALITLSSPALGDAVKESMAAAKMITKTAQSGDNSELLAALVGQFQDKKAAKAAQPKIESKDPQEIIAQLLDNVTATTALLDAKATPEEAAEIKQWLYDMAVVVAEAAKEGDFMGIGGERVNAAEKAMLQQISDTLGL
jgi:hypothetical protein